MFTGIVEDLGTVVARDGGRFRFATHGLLDDARLGDSIAVNGCCLTVVAMDATAAEPWWEADAVAETLARTNLDDLAVGDRVN
ncbi:MAG: riboflavin synthase, partial [Microthrixaceae bacterium]|nr:riboflavin synthase [Microthrixaceae bacterium]